MNPCRPPKLDKLARIITDDGEVTGHILPAPPRPRKRKLNRSFAFVWLEDGSMLDLLIHDKSLTVSDIRILLYIVKKIEYENKFFGTQKEIAEKLGFHIETVREAIRKLTRKGFLLKRKHLEVNHCLAFRGSAKSLHKKTEERYREVMESTFDETD